MQASGWLRRWQKFTMLRCYGETTFNVLYICSFVAPFWKDNDLPPNSVVADDAAETERGAHRREGGVGRSHAKRVEATEATRVHRGLLQLQIEIVGFLLGRSGLRSSLLLGCGVDRSSSSVNLSQFATFELEN